MNRAVVLALGLSGCVVGTDLGEDAFEVRFVLGARATCASDDRTRLFCVGDGTDARLGIDPTGLDESCGGAPCTSVFSQSQNASIRDVAWFEDGGNSTGVASAAKAALSEGGDQGRAEPDPCRNT